MIGTTYLCKYNEKIYALKIQKILKNQIKKNYNSDIWREIDIYNYISKMNKKNLLFFTHLYGYKIFNNCDHIQIRPFEINFENKENKFFQKLKQIDESKWCIKYLLEYKGNTTLNNILIDHFTKNNILTIKQIYSIMIQMIHIILLLSKGGYSHNDFHQKNIMINKTNSKYFIMKNKKINYNEYQISAIDYGKILNKKFNLKFNDYYTYFLTKPKTWIFYELANSILKIMFYSEKLENKIDKEKEKLNQTDGFKKIIENHNIEFNKILDKYIKIFPKGKKLKKILNSQNLILNTIAKNKKYFYFKPIMIRIEMEFDLKYPNLYKKYFNTLSETKWLLPKNQCLEILLINKTNNFIKYLIDKI